MEGWQDLVAWDEELYDPMFQVDNSFAGVQDGSFSSSFRGPGSFASEPPYLISAPPSVVDGPSSLGYTASGPPSVHDGQSSIGIPNHTGLSYETTTTSPLVDQDNDHYFGSFGACDNYLSPLGSIIESPVLDTRYERIVDSFQSSTSSFETTTETIFNPHVLGSSHAFSGLDVQASQAFSNAGSWADQPQIIEPIAEGDESRAEVAPIEIPYAYPEFGSLSSHLRSEGAYSQRNRTRAITIPEASRRVASYNPDSPYLQWTQRSSPSLSVSPVTQRRVRNVALSRSTSQSRRKLATPSPTDSYGWVSYHANPLTNKLAPTSAEGLPGRTPRGRKKGLTAEQRSHAALMRIVGSCANCQRGKRRCDPGTPCKPCLEHYKGDLVNHPCRDRSLSDLCGAFLSERLGWHPTGRPLKSFTAPGGFDISSGVTYPIPLTFGFGSALPVWVNAIQLKNDQTLVHEHIVYSWPPGSPTGSPHRHAVLPAILTPEAASNLTPTLDSHLSLLVTHHFRSFPLYCSPLRILREVYIFSRSISRNAPHARTLHQALKLLVLVHVGGDITLPSQADHPVLSQLIHKTMDISDELSPTPCFIRAQFGAIMPGLALRLMKDVLSSFEQLLLNRDCSDWPMALAILMTILMTVESIHYHSAKLPYHHNYDPAPHSDLETDLKDDDEGVKALLTFYSACYSGCHARLQPGWEGEASQHTRQSLSAEDTFIESVRDAMRKANDAEYLSVKASGMREDDDMGFFFDRLVARLLLLKT